MSERRTWSRRVGPLVFIAVLSAAASQNACSEKEDDLSGVARLALTQVPADVRCIRITASGSRTVTALFDVAPNTSSVLDMTGIPTGMVQFVGDAFAEACALVGPNSLPNWSSVPQSTTVTSTTISDVTLVMTRTGRTTINVDFQGGMSMCIPAGGTCGGATPGTCCAGTCDPATGRCPGATPTCSDGVKNGSETDVDCGGSCGACANGRACLVAGDCQSGNCVQTGTALTCQPAAPVPSCSDGVKNGSETDVDCGGTCGACANGRACLVAGDCQSGSCVQTGTALTCQPAAPVPSCSDGVKNGSETDVDCGASCGACANGRACLVAGDCQSGNCVQTGTALTCQPTGAAPLAFAAAGAGVAGTGDLAVPYPAGLAAGKLLILQVGSRSANVPTTPAGWTLLSFDQNGTPRQRLYYKFATGAEAGVLNLVCGVSNVNAARMYLFNGGSATVMTQGSTAVTGTLGTQPGPTISVASTAGRLVLAFVALDNNPTVMSTFTGATGGTWSEPVSEFTTDIGSNFGLQIQIGTFVGASTSISGGSANLGGGSDDSICRAFALN